jgi:hypothetical protein
LPFPALSEDSADLFSATSSLLESPKLRGRAQPFFFGTLSPSALLLRSAVCS